MHFERYSWQYQVLENRKYFFNIYKMKTQYVGNCRTEITFDLKYTWKENIRAILFFQNCFIRNNPKHEYLHIYGNKTNPTK